MPPLAMIETLYNTDTRAVLCTRPQNTNFLTLQILDSPDPIFKVKGFSVQLLAFRFDLSAYHPIDKIEEWK
jgi:hypothetical protein